MVCQMHSADFDVRLGLVKRLSRQLDLRIPREIRTLVATEITGGARELCGALKRIKIASLAENRPIGRELVEESIASLKEQMCVPVQLPDIEKAVCDVFGVSSDALHSHRKCDAASCPRTLAMWLARKHTRAALSEIGSYFGRRSHSSVISAQKKVEGWMLQQARLTAGRRTCRVDEAIRRVEELLRRRA
jgi:chromosomal replication initiator protein